MSVEKLLSSASAPVASSVALDTSFIEGQILGEAFKELTRMMSLRNGFYAFEQALHVRPWLDSKSDRELGLQAWNDRKLWRDWYQGLTDGMFFFAEDAFGGQFAIKGNGIVSFDPESGSIEPLALSLEDWAGKILLNYAQLTGYPVAHSWQAMHGPIPTGKRLLPKVPFALGGAYEAENLYAVDAVKGMRYRGELLQQIRDLPDGAKVRLKALPLQ